MGCESLELGPPQKSSSFLLRKEVMDPPLMALEKSWSRQLRFDCSLSLNGMGRGGGKGG